MEHWIAGVSCYLPLALGLPCVRHSMSPCGRPNPLDICRGITSDGGGQRGSRSRAMLTGLN
jgi:hypothetical protein